MPESLLQTDAYLRVVVFIALFAVLALLEFLQPRRTSALDRLVRWPGNLVLLLMDSIALRLLFPLGAAGIAYALQQGNVGLLNSLDIATLPAWIITLLALDLVIYLQHRVFHAVPLFWRFHGVHHTDADMDLTTGIRFHPVEILLSMLLKLAVIAALGAPPAAVLIFEIALSGMSLFVHSNLRLPLQLDHLLRYVVVTPDMHRIHHSRISAELNSNFGTGLVFWDRLLKTYRQEPQLGHDGMEIGLQGHAGDHWQRIDHMLLWPWREGLQRIRAGRKAS